MKRNFHLLLFLLWACGLKTAENQNLSFTYCLDQSYDKIRANDEWYQIFRSYLISDSANHYMGGLIPAEDTLIVSLLNKPDILMRGSIIRKDSVINQAGIQLLKVLEKRGNFFNYRLVLTERQPALNILLIDLPKEDSLFVLQAYQENRNINLITVCR